MSQVPPGAFSFSDQRLSNEKIIKSYVVTLMGRHRHVKAQFFYNRLTQSSYSIAAKGSNNLQELLKRRFGADAIAVLVDGDAWYSDEEMLKANVLDEVGGRYYVLYDDNSPSYSEATTSQLPSSTPATSTNTARHSDPAASSASTGTTQVVTTTATTAPETRQESGAVAPTFGDFPPHYYDTHEVDMSHRATREERVHGFTLFTKIPSFTIRIHLRTSNGSTRPLVFQNKDTSHIDQLMHHLSAYGGSRWVGLLVHGIEFVDDGVMFSPWLEQDATYHVTYAPPSKFAVLDRLSEKRREVVYSTVAESERVRPYGTSN